MGGISPLHKYAVATANHRTQQRKWMAYFERKTGRQILQPLLPGFHSHLNRLSHLCRNREEMGLLKAHRLFLARLSYCSRSLESQILVTNIGGVSVELHVSLSYDGICNFTKASNIRSGN